MAYKAKQGVVVCKLHAMLNRIFQLMADSEWLKLFVQHVAPDKGEHLIRDYSWLSNFRSPVVK